jgi:hypothetical protein
MTLPFSGECYFQRTTQTMKVWGAVGLHFATADPQRHLQTAFANRVPKTLRVGNDEKPVHYGYF